jgi:dipeptidase
MTRLMISFLVLMIVSILAAGPASACTSYLVTPGASVDGSSMISYAADSHIRYGELYFLPGGPREPGSYYQVYDRSTHKPLAKIPHPESTFQVVGFLNERQVSIGETTYGGRSALEDTTGGIDYGSLMFLALQRSASAREAIAVMGRLVEEYGYYSSGESFSIADPYEVWIMEMIGKGTDLQHDPGSNREVNRNKGAVWVARRIPDGYISAHANQARITTFPQADGRTSITCRQLERIHEPGIETIYAHDVISFARSEGFFDGPDHEFSFADAYAPWDFGAARFCEARVWSMFRQVDRTMDRYRDYALGFDQHNRMPLWIEPERKLSVKDLIAFKRDHLQNTDLDMQMDLGAGPWGKPYRWRPLTWEVDGKKYFHERTTATQQTAFSFISQLRRDLPDPIGGIIWFGVDDANTTVYVPMYAGMTRVPPSYAEGNGHILEYSDDAAFWVFNKVAHLAYLRYSLKLPDVRGVQAELENHHQAMVAAIDRAALELHGRDAELAREFLTRASVNMAQDTIARWQELYRYLLVKFLDGNIKQTEDGVFLTNEWGKYPIVEHPRYPEWWLRLIVESTGDRFLYLEDEEG